MARALTIVFCLVLLASTFAAKTRLTSAQEKKIKELKDNKLGALILGLAELHFMSQGPVEDLEEAIDALISDIEEKIASNDEQYNERSLQNQSENTRLSGLISEAEVSISNTEDILNNILYPTLAQLEERLANFHLEVEENNAYVTKITFEREENHAAYEARVEEHNEALAAVDECLEILNQFGGSSVTLLQTKKIQGSIKKVTKSLKRGINQSMIKALATLATSEFADSSAILNVIHALEEVKASIQEALELEHTNEASSVALFEEEVAERERDNRRLGREINLTNGEIDGTERRIADKETFLAIRQQDLRNFTSELEEENAAFVEATDFYEDVRTELEREASVAHDTQSLVANSGFGANLSGNLG